MNSAKVSENTQSSQQIGDSWLCTYGAAVSESTFWGLDKENAANIIPHKTQADNS